jgi:hypothetical protein
VTGGAKPNPRLFSDSEREAALEQTPAAIYVQD